KALCSATDLPVSADLENCYADAPEAAAKALLDAAHAGVVGGSIEDYSGDASAPIYTFEHALERVQAAAEAVSTLDFPFTLTARAEGVLRGVHDLDDTIARLQAFEAAGADVLYAPGLTTLDQVRAVTAAVNKPVMVLVAMLRGVTVAQLSAAGVRRVSVGGARALAAGATLRQAGGRSREDGGFGG